MSPRLVIQIWQVDGDQSTKPRRGALPYEQKQVRNKRGNLHDLTTTLLLTQILIENPFRTMTSRPVSAHDLALNMSPRHIPLNTI
ncbi:uncharacterized protein LAJ45_10033 [Morchella importuna]|uniref:uncharacterized protein n=1 Tax=Morchella importuna TaxID=1174673 RepID=UPI001E8EBAE7|nr:uncharacterized protein LAJ45_10033 [Morchella importuna]KAH8145891.1 hypothetical protein LAJ45_10033 [Morchella importuna]